MEVCGLFCQSSFRGLWDTEASPELGTVLWAAEEAGVREVGMLPTEDLLAARTTQLYEERQELVKGG